MDNVEEKFVSDDGVSSVPAAVTPEGGEGKKDKLKKTTTDEPKGAVDGKKVIPGQSDAGKPVPTAEETEVDAEVVEVDVDNQRISLGMKQLTQDPWDDIDRLYRMGDVIKGKVSRVAGYGAFIQLEQDIDGLVHISFLPLKKLQKF